MEPATRRVLSARAAVADRLLQHARLRVRAWGTGYQVSDGRGRTSVAADLDGLGRTCGGSGARLSPWSGGRTTEEQEVVGDLADDRGLVSVWSTCVAHLAQLQEPLRLLLPDPVRDGTLQLDIRPGAVQVELLHRQTERAVLAGRGAGAAVDHLRRSAVVAADGSGR